MRRRLKAALLAIAPALLASVASAANLHRFDIRAEPVGEALIDFAIQSNVSLGGSARCTGLSEPLAGDFTIEAGLARLLANSSCRFVVVAPDTVRIIAAERPARAAATRGAVTRAAAPAAAEQQPSVQPPDIIISATRRPAIAARLDGSISVVGAAAMQDAGTTDASDIAAQLAGVTTTNLGPGRDKILLRGLSDGDFTGRTQSTVGIYLDDTPITFNAPDPDLRLTDVKAVEVLRGPQGFLYGGGSISGVYRIVTQEPLLNVHSQSLLVGGSLTSDGAPSGEFESVTNVPLAPDRAALRLVLYGEDDGGYIDNVTRRKSNIDGTTRGGGRAALRVLTGSGWSVTLGATYQRIVTNDTQYVTPSLGRAHVANQIAQSSDNSFGQLNLVLERDYGWVDFKSTTAVIRHDFFSQTNASTALPLFGAANGRVGAYDEPTAITSLIEDDVLASPGIGKFQWLAGVFGSISKEHTDPDVRASATATVPSEILYVEHRTDQLDSLALYGQVSYALTRQWALEAGVRAFVDTVTTDSAVAAPALGQKRPFSGSEDSDGVSPKVALKFQMNDRVLIYALASEGHRGGGFNTAGPIGTVFAAATVPALQRRFTSDQIQNLETGLKSGWFDDRLRLRSALFYDIWNNIQTDQFLRSGLSYTANAGNGRNYGFESEMTYQITPRLKLSANGIANAPELVRGDQGFIFPEHVSLPGVPDLSGGLEAAYEWPLSERLSVQLAAQSQYIGRSRVTFNPITAPPMGGYTLNRISAQLRGPNWRLSAFLSNPTNETGNTFSYGNPFAFQQIAEVTPQRPLTMRMTLGVDF